MTQEVITAQINDFDRLYLELDKQVDAAEKTGFWARWMFGRQIEDERDASGGILPDGRMEQLCRLVGKKPTELQNRSRFFREYVECDSQTSLLNALSRFGCDSWHELCASLGKRGLQSSDSNEWYTPAQYIVSARRVLGAIDLDPASSWEANQIVKAPKFYHLEDSGLIKPWPGRIWLNPPYGTLTGEFVQKLTTELLDGTTQAAIVLVNSHATDSDWFQKLWDADALCFTDHRIDFKSPHKKETGSTHGSVFAYFGPAPEKFATEFEVYGAVVRRWQP